jgi:hypothetical protein
MGAIILSSKFKICKSYSIRNCFIINIYVLDLFFYNVRKENFLTVIHLSFNEGNISLTPPN